MTHFAPPISSPPKGKITSGTQVTCQFIAEQNLKIFHILQICCEECHLLLDLKKLLNFLLTLDCSTDITKVINRHYTIYHSSVGSNFSFHSTSLQSWCIEYIFSLLFTALFNEHGLSILLLSTNLTD